MSMSKQEVLKLLKEAKATGKPVETDCTIIYQTKAEWKEECQRRDLIYSPLYKKMFESYAIGDKKSAAKFQAEIDDGLGKLKIPMFIESDKDREENKRISARGTFSI